MLARTIILGVAFASLIPGVAAADARGEVKFAFDSAQLPRDADEQLRGIVAFAALHPDSRIVLDAYCDPVGTSPYNIGLAIRRATAVRTRLNALGIPDEQVVFAIYGKNGVHLARHADDRRVTLWPTHEPLAMVIEHTLAANGTVVTWHTPLSVAQIEALPETIAIR